MTKNLSKFGISLFAALFLFSQETLAQKNSCNLQINVYEFKDDGTAEQFPVIDAKIKLVNKKTKKTLKINQENGINSANVTEASYSIIISKEGFKNTSREFTVDCPDSDAQNTISEIYFLWQGNSAETIKMNLGSFGRYYTETPLKKTSDTPTENNAALKEAKEDSAPKSVVNGIASNLVKPAYPKAARAVRASGAVNVQVTINELGHVISAKAISGHPLLRPASIEAAKASKFRMTTLDGIPVKVTGVIVYNFVP